MRSLLNISDDEVMTIMVGSMATGRQKWCENNGLHINTETMRQKEIADLGWCGHLKPQLQ